MDFKPWGHNESKVAVSAASKYIKTVPKKERNDEERFKVMEKALNENGFSRSLQEIKLFHEGCMLTIQKRKSGDMKSNPSVKHKFLQNITEDNSKGKDIEISKVKNSSKNSEELLSKENNLFCSKNGIGTGSDIDHSGEIINSTNTVSTDNKAGQMLKDMKSTPSELKENSITKITNRNFMLNQNQENIDNGINISSLINNIDNELNLNDKSLLKQNNLEGGFEMCENVEEVDIINCIKMAPAQDTTKLCTNTTEVERIHDDKNILQNKSHPFEKINISTKIKKSSIGNKCKEPVQNVKTKTSEQQNLFVSKKRIRKSFDSDQTSLGQDLKSICKKRNSAENSSNVIMGEKEENISRESHLTVQTDLQDFNSSTHLVRVNGLDNKRIRIGTSDCHNQSQCLKMLRSDKEDSQVDKQTTNKKENNSLAINVNGNALEEVVSHRINSERLSTETPVQEIKSHEDIEATVNTECKSLSISKKKRISTCGVIVSRENKKQKVTNDLCEGHKNNKLYSEPTTYQMTTHDNNHKKTIVQTNRKFFDNCRLTKNNSTDDENPTKEIPSYTSASVITLTNEEIESICAGTKRTSSKSGDRINRLNKSKPNKKNDSEIKSLVKDTLKESPDIENKVCKSRVNKTKKVKKATNNALIENIDTNKFNTLDSSRGDKEYKSDELKIITSSHQDEDKFNTRSNIKTNKNEVNINEGFRSAVSSIQPEIIAPLKHTPSRSTDQISPSCNASSSGNPTTTRNIPAQGKENGNTAKKETECKNMFIKESQLKIISETNEIERVIQESISHEIPLDTIKESLGIDESKILEEVLLDNTRTKSIINVNDNNIKIIEVKTPTSLHQNQEEQTLTDENNSKPIKKRGRKKKNSLTLKTQKDTEIPCRRSKRNSIDFQDPIQHELSRSSTTTSITPKQIRSNDTSYESDNSFEKLVSTLANEENAQETTLCEVDSKIECSNIEVTTDVWPNEPKDIQRLKSIMDNDHIMAIKSCGQLGNKGLKKSSKPFNCIQENVEDCMIKESNTTVISKQDAIINMNETRCRSTNNQIKNQFAKSGSRKASSKDDVVYMFRNPSPPHFHTTILSPSQRETITKAFRVDLDKRTKNISNSDKNQKEVDTPGEQLNRLDSDDRRRSKIKRLQSGIKCLPKMIKNLRDQLNQTKRLIKKEIKKQHLQQEKHLQEVCREHEQLQSWFVEILKQFGYPHSKSEAQD